MKTSQSKPVRAALVLLVASAFLLTAARAQQTGDNSSQSNNTAPANLQEAPAVPQIKKTRKVKGITKPSAEDVLPACPTQAEAKPEDKANHSIKAEAKPPRILEFSEAAYSKEARKKHIEGTATISLTVTADGLPTNLCLAKGIGYGLDEQAALSVRQYKFAPATVDGKAVSVPIKVQVNFRLY